MAPIDRRTVLITGGTAGLGLRLARDLADQGATVLVTGRDPARGEHALRLLKKTAAGDRAEFLRADFASLAQVRRLADDVLARVDRLDVLVNNAGIGVGPPGDRRREVSEDGHELRFAVNYLAAYLLTSRLLPLLARSAPARIVNVASIGQAPIDPDDIMLERGYDAMRAYAQSKLALVSFTFDLAGRLAGTGVTVTALHPATMMDTDMVRETGAPVMSTVREGADATLRLITDPALDGVTGRYFEGTREADPNPQANDPEARERLHRLSARLTASSPAPSGAPTGSG